MMMLSRVRTLFHGIAPLTLAWGVLSCTPPPSENVTEPQESVPEEVAPSEEVSSSVEEEAARPSTSQARPPEERVAARAPAPVVEEPEDEPAPPDVVPDVVEVELPEGTILELELLTALDSSINRVGDEIQARTRSPLYVAGEQVLGTGALVEGRVTEVESSGRVKGRARLGFTFDRLATGTGREKIRTSFVEQEAEGGEKKDAAVIGGAAGVGAIVGGIVGGKKGAAIGASIGGAGGTGVVLSTKGQEIRLPVGTELNVRLEESVTIERH